MGPAWCISEIRVGIRCVEALRLSRAPALAFSPGQPREISKALLRPTLAVALRVLRFHHARELDGAPRCPRRKILLRGEVLLECVGVNAKHPANLRGKAKLTVLEKHPAHLNQLLCVS